MQHEQHMQHQALIQFIRQMYPSTITEEFIPLHVPTFGGNEKEYLNDCIDSTYVSSIGSYVSRFEQMIVEFTGAKFAVATVSGTSALHMALKLAGVNAGDEVITQPLTFVATCNAIAYCGASPVFVDVSKATLGMCPDSLRQFLTEHTMQTGAGCMNKITGKKITAVVPMHTFGHPCQLDDIVRICEQFNLPLVEDAAESLGSYYRGRHTGTFGKLGIFSFNGNKTITTGGGGMIVTDDAALAKRAKHMTTTAKLPHPFEFFHDEIGYNYRLPNLNAALGCAQMEMLNRLLASKRQIALAYRDFFNSEAARGAYRLVLETGEARSNYWLNTIILGDLEQRNALLDEFSADQIMARPAWHLINELPMYQQCQTSDLANARWLADRIVNIPSSAKLP